MNSNRERLDIIEATLMCGEDADCENCPLYLEDDCKQHYFDGTLYDEAMKAISEMREQED